MECTHVATIIYLAEGTCPHVVTSGIFRVHIEVLQVVTIIEGIFTDACNAFWQRELRETCAVVESVLADALDTRQRQRDACHLIGSLEGIIANGSNPVGGLIMSHHSRNRDVSGILA